GIEHQQEVREQLVAGRGQCIANGLGLAFAADGGVAEELPELGVLFADDQHHFFQGVERLLGLVALVGQPQEGFRVDAGHLPRVDGVERLRQALVLLLLVHVFWPLRLTRRSARASSKRRWWSSTLRLRPIALAEIRVASWVVLLNVSDRASSCIRATSV